MELCPGGTRPVWNHFYLGFKLQRSSLTLSMLKATFYVCWYNLQTVQTMIRTNRKLVLISIDVWCTPLVFPKTFLKTLILEKKRSDDNKSMQNYQACREKLFSILSSVAEVSYLSQFGWWHSWEHLCEIFESGQWLKRCCSKKNCF